MNTPFLQYMSLKSLCSVHYSLQHHNPYNRYVWPMFPFTRHSSHLHTHAHKHSLALSLSLPVCLCDHVLKSGVIACSMRRRERASEKERESRKREKGRGRFTWLWSLGWLQSGGKRISKPALQRAASLFISWSLKTHSPKGGRKAPSFSYTNQLA